MFTPRELSIYGKTQGFGMIDSLDNLVINSDFYYLLTCGKVPQVNNVILLREKFLQFDWLRAVVFQLDLKYLHVKISKSLRVIV